MQQMHGKMKTQNKKKLGEKHRHTDSKLINHPTKIKGDTQTAR
jgi:hypothetical protein